MRTRWIALALLGGVATGGTAPAQTVEGRVDRLERELRAVQRRVFPDGAGQLAPQITSPTTTSGIAAPGTAATTPLTDITARIDALESQLSTLTGQVEQNGFRLRQLDEAFASYRRATDARLKALETAPAAPAAEPAAALAEPARATTPAAAAARPAAAATPATVTTAAGTIARPDTGDAGEDGYIYGYRLWEAKRFADAQRQLKATVDKYPTHRRASFAQNLLGRAYLDEGKPALASVAFYDNYKKMPDGERAPDSLYYLGQALVQLKKPADACKVYAELLDVYDARVTASLRADVAKAQAAAKCK